MSGKDENFGEDEVLACKLALAELAQHNPRIADSPEVSEAVANGVRQLAAAGQRDLDRLISYGVSRGIIAFYAWKKS